ncbi:MAG: pirin family protein [Pseudomonadota bacterium]|nr:pirin family protein [Pseudomonadota bacterium]
MITLRSARDRGRAHFGWLRSAHTFSFGDYYDPRFNGFSALRVINDDRVSAGKGFATHGHRNMEIISYVLEGSIAHRDSTGNEKILPAGEFQLMSAGSGITHSEFNPSATDELHFLQIWIEPDEKDTPPGYQQQPFARTSAIQPVITPDGRDGTLTIRQNAVVSHVRLQAESIRQSLDSTRSYYLHVIRGPLTVTAGGGVLHLQEGDGLGLKEESVLELASAGNSEALLFDLPGARQPAL